MFGLTGGLGSGKSTVAARFRARGLTVVDADQLAREVVAKGSAALREIAGAFGDEMLDADGNLDRARLAEAVFHDADKRRTLNAITHPRVRELSQQRFQECGERGETLCCYEVPLLVESGLADALRPVVVVAAPEAEQVRRAMRRDDVTEAHARARIAAQLPLSDKIAVADHVIVNDGTLAELEARADAVLDAILVELGIDAALYPKR